MSSNTVLNSNGDQALFGLGGDALAPTAPSESMTANFVGLLEDSLGRGVWADPVASQLARPLNAILAYLPPEGARVRRRTQAALRFKLEVLVLHMVHAKNLVSPINLPRFFGATYIGCLTLRGQTRDAT